MGDFKSKSAGYMANHLARLFASGLQQRIDPLGLAPAQFMTLLELWDEDGRTQADLMLCLEVEQATMANTLIRMERDGLIVRRAHPTDKRARLVFLTPKSRVLETAALSAAMAQNAVALADLNAEEQEQFLSLMARVMARLKREKSQTAP